MSHFLKQDNSEPTCVFKRTGYSASVCKVFHCYNLLRCFCCQITIFTAISDLILLTSRDYPFWTYQTGVEVQKAGVPDLLCPLLFYELQLFYSTQYRINMFTNKWLRGKIVDFLHFEGLLFGSFFVFVKFGYL